MRCHVSMPASPLQCHQLALPVPTAQSYIVILSEAAAWHPTEAVDYQTRLATSPCYSHLTNTSPPPSPLPAPHT